MRVPDDFATQLLARLRSRTDAGVTTYFLDLRHHRFGRMGKLAVRNPDGSQWPVQGTAITDAEAARRVVLERYVPYLATELRVRRAVDLPSPTTQVACALYLAAKAAQLGATHNTVQNQRSALNHHVVPVLGAIPLIQLTKTRVQALFDAMRVRGLPSDEHAQEQPARSTKRALLIALRAVWRHTYPDEPIPFAGVRLAPPPAPSPAAEGAAGASQPAATTERRRIPSATDSKAPTASRGGWTESGDVTRRDLLRAYSYGEIEHLLTAAMALDHSDIASRPNQRAWSTPNNAGLIAVCVGTGMRISEISRWTWGNLNLPLRAATATNGVLGKTDAAHRYFPLQTCLGPWLVHLWEEQQRLNGGRPPNEHDAVIRGLATLASPGAAKRTLQGKIARALEHAGLKRPRRLTHIFRATHISWGVLADEFRLPVLQSFVGHKRALGNTTSDYFELLPEQFHGWHFTYISLPSPDQVRARLSSFQPGPPVSVAAANAPWHVPSFRASASLSGT